MEDIIVWLRSSADEYGMGRCNEAADRIEKLEALVEQLRNDNSSMIDDYDTDFLRQEKRIEKLEAALREIALDDPDCCMIADRMRETAEIALGLKND